MKLHLDFNDWFAGNSEPVHITKKEMAEVPSPGSDWGYSHSSEYKGRPTKNQWTKQGQRAIPAFTTPEELFDPHRPHSGYSKAAYYQNKPTGHEDNGGLDSPEPTATTPVPQPPQPARPKTSDRPPWVLAKAKVDETLLDHNGENHKIRKGQHVALKDNGDKTWAYATIWKGKLQWHNAHMSPKDLSGRFASVKGEDGNPIRGMKASELAASVHTEEAGEFTPTDEQQDISDTFEKSDSHMMISARAGTGKTTSLKELAKKHSKGERWLYLVFNKKNQTEAASAFPRSVEVKTSNAFGGYVIAENRKIIPTNQGRIVDVGGSSRLSTMQEWGTEYDSYLYDSYIKDELNMGGDDDHLNYKTKIYSKRVKKTFNTIVGKVVSKAKSYGTSPKATRNDDYDIETILQQHMFDTNMEKIKDSVSDNDDREMINKELSEFFNVGNFLATDFEKRVEEAAEWLLAKSMPGEHDEEFKQQSYTGKELRKMFGSKAPNKEALGDKQTWSMYTSKVKNLFANSNTQPKKHRTKDFRDFADDVWYLSQHADELNWPKYKVVLVDEVQDFNRGQRTMLDHLMKAGARIIAVGDEKQGIYRFNGADHESFGEVGKMLEDGSTNKEDVQKTLTKNWRSKPGIVDHSNDNSVVNDLQAGIAHDEHDEAHISNREHKLDKTIKRLQTEFSSLGELKKETAFIARNNAPLLKAAMELMKIGMPFKVEGKDLAGDTSRMISDIADHGNLQKNNTDYVKADTIQKFEETLGSYEEHKRKEIGEAGKKGKNMGSELKELESTTEGIRAAVEMFIENKPAGLIPDFTKFIWARLGGGKEGISLTTAHKAKGLEFERVYDIAPSLYGANASIKKAGELALAADDRLDRFKNSHDLDNLSDEDEKDLHALEKKAKNFRIRYEGDASQEEHAHYVTGTRAKDEFHIVDDTPDREE